VYAAGDEITLIGVVTRSPMKAAAGRAACRVPRVARLVNSIRIELSPTQ
jgi:hypothetical protein